MELKYEIEEIGEDRYRVEIKLFNEVTLGILYFENPKQRWFSKPIMSDKLRCVDAKVEGLYVYGGENITPKMMVAKCQDLLSEYIKERGIKKGISKKSEYKEYGPNDESPSAAIPQGGDEPRE
jgi:hypothetical protein